MTTNKTSMEAEYNSYWRSDERETIQEDFQKIVSVLTVK